MAGIVAVEEHPAYDPTCYLCPGNPRALGDVKSQQISANDVTKQYTDLSTDAIAQLTFADLITSHGYDRHIRTVRLRYRRRRDLIPIALMTLESETALRPVPTGVTGSSSTCSCLTAAPCR